MSRVTGETRFCRLVSGLTLKFSLLQGSSDFVLRSAILRLLRCFQSWEGSGTKGPQLHATYSVRTPREPW